jgi:hypothetical protein
VLPVLIINAVYFVVVLKLEGHWGGGLREWNIHRGDSKGVLPWENFEKVQDILGRTNRIFSFSRTGTSEKTRKVCDRQTA